MSDMSNPPEAAKTAVIHRMVMPSPHLPLRPEGAASAQAAGYEVEDRHLTTREETDAFKAEHGVADHAPDLHRRRAHRRL